MSDKQIIVLDKDKEFIEALSDRLKICGLIPAGVTSSASFFQIASKMTPSLILLSDNIENPGWSEVLSRINHSSLKGLAPFILLYSERSPALYQQAKIYGIKKMLQKPFRFVELLYLMKDELKGTL